MKILYPLQGFWNFLSYTRPKFNRLRITAPDRSLMSTLYRAISLPKQTNNPLSQEEEVELSLIGLSSIDDDGGDSEEIGRN